MNSGNKDLNSADSLSKALLKLSDALEELAYLLARQKILDQSGGGKDLQVISTVIRKAADEKEKQSRRNLNAKIKRSWKKDFLENWLYERNCMLGEHKKNLRVDDRLFKAAEFLARHYRELMGFYKQLKHHQNIKQDFILKTPASAMKIIRQWAKMLLENKLIDGFETLNQNTADVDIAEITRATEFINGLWLEIYLRRQIGKLMREEIDNIHSFDILANAKLELPGNVYTEIDLLLMLNDVVYWFECKSGEIGKKYYDIFKRNREIFKLPQSRSFLIVPTMQFHQADVLKKRSGMSLLYADKLPVLLKKHIFNKLSPNATR